MAEAATYDAVAATTAPPALTATAALLSSCDATATTIAGPAPSASEPQKWAP